MCSTGESSARRGGERRKAKSRSVGIIGAGGVEQKLGASGLSV